MFQVHPDAAIRRGVLARSCSLVSILVWSVALAGCASLATAPPPAFDLTGNWALVAAESDAAPGLAGPGAEPMPSGQRRGGRRRAGGAGAMGAGAMAVGQALLFEDAFSVQQDAAAMTLSFADHPVQDIRFGESTEMRGTVTAGWTEDGVLEVRRERGRGEHLQRFELSQDGTRLVVETMLDVPRGPGLRLRRVFERVARAPAQEAEESSWDRPMRLDVP